MATLLNCTLTCQNAHPNTEFSQKTRELCGAHTHIMPGRNRTLNDTQVQTFETISTRSNAKFPDRCGTKCDVSNASIDDHVMEHHKNAQERNNVHVKLPAVRGTHRRGGRQKQAQLRNRQHRRSNHFQTHMEHRNHESPNFYTVPVTHSPHNASCGLPCDSLARGKF
jgi:hypothetical protein